MFGKPKIRLEERHQAALLEGMPSQYTPDIATLERYERQTLFLSDEWISDRRQNFILDDLGPDACQRKGIAFTMRHYSFRVFTGFLAPEWTPVAMEDREYGFKIKGELVSIRPNVFLMLDKLKQNGVQFIRERVRIIKPYREGPIVFENTTEERSPHHTWTGGIDWMHGKFPYGHPLAGKKCWIGPERLTFMPAWIYLGKRDYWGRYRKQPYLFQKVPTFKPKKDKAWLSEYYKYQNPDIVE